MKIFEQLKPIKYYAIFCAVVFGIYMASGLYGHYLIGDDDEARDEQPSGRPTHSRRSNFYHK